MKFNVNRYEDFKALTNSFADPKVFYTVNSGIVQSLASFSSRGDPYAYAAGPIQGSTPESTLLTDFPGASVLVSLNVI